MRRITKYFFEGLIVIIPITVTLYVFYYLFISIDSLFDFKVPGLGFLVTLLLIIAVGIISSNFLTGKIIGIIDKILAKVPLVNLVYVSIKDLINAFVGEKKKFNKPALVTVDKEQNIKLLGFITEEELDNFNLSNEVAVYIPQSYNIAGNLLFVKKEMVTPIQVPAKEVMTFIVSGGLTKLKK